jgi:hypothetical protein
MTAFTPPPPRSLPPEANKIREVFVSATARDLKALREQVADALKVVPAGVYLQEEWSSPAANVVSLSYDKLTDSDAYFGLFGFRYGWIPDGHVKSITELECDKALDHWRGPQHDPPPIFWFVPEPGTDLAVEILKEAERVLAEEYPNDEARREESRSRQRAFRDRLSQANRFVRTFGTVTQLRERAIATVQNWSIDIVLRAAARNRTAVVQIPPADLGAIGRSEQRDAVEAAVLAVTASGSPGLCLAVHGPGGAGQFEFKAFLEQSNPWEISATPHLITPSHEKFRMPSLVAATLAEMSLVQETQPPTIELVAAAIGERCRTEPVVMILHVWQLADDLDTYRNEFWLPLLAAARQLPATPQPRHPFIVVLMSVETLDTASAVFIDRVPATPADYDKIVLVPELGALSAKDVSSWLAGYKMGLQRRNEIAARVVGNGRPRDVYGELNDEAFWSTLQQ